MSGLLIKIFLWFWLALAFIAASIVLTILTIENGPFFSAMRGLVRNSMLAYANQAVVIYEREGEAATAQFLEDLQRTAGIQVELYDAQARSLSGRNLWPPEDEVLSLARKALQQESGAYRVTLSMTRLASPLRSRRGTLYCLAGKWPASYAQNWRADSRAFLWRLLVALLTTAVICYWLARYLTKPIVQLQQATRRIAAGDLTARVSHQLERRNDEIADLAQDFNRMADCVGDLLEGQRRLLGDISHELRSPLTRLNIALALARQQTGDIASAEHDRIELEAERLNELIGQLLELARVEGGAAQMDLAPIRLVELLEDIAADADFEARSRQRLVTFVVPATDVHSFTINASPSLLRSAIENVVRNAVRYTAEATTVQIELTREKESALIAVSDCGPGVPSDTLDKLFQPFYRVSVARERDTGGTGLGLAITARTVGLLSGTVAARNLSTGGLCVEIRLPLVQT